MKEEYGVFLNSQNCWSKEQAAKRAQELKDAGFFDSNITVRKINFWDKTGCLYLEQAQVWNPYSKYFSPPIVYSEEVDKWLRNL